MDPLFRYPTALRVAYHTALHQVDGYRGLVQRIEPDPRPSRKGRETPGAGRTPPLMSTDTPQRRPFRLIALDLDGTLLTDEKDISDADSSTLKAFVQAGGVVVLASGRMTDNVRPLYDRLGFDGPTIAYNGALVREPRSEGGKVILETGLPARYADELIDYTRRERLHLNYYLDEKLYARDNADLRYYADLYSRQTGAVYQFIPCLATFRGLAPTKLIIVTDPTIPDQPDPRHRDELYHVWSERWGSEVTVMRTNPEYLEFYNIDTSKGTALKAVAEHYGIPQELTLAFGDNFNDAAMLRWAGCGVAVANAHPDVRAMVQWVSPLTNNESAVADAIHRLVS